MKYFIAFILLSACGQKRQSHELQIMIGYKDEDSMYGPYFSDGVSGSITYVHHDKKHNRYDTVIIEVKRQEP